MALKNRKGDLRDNITELIIGVLCLLLIIAAIVIIYKALTNQEDTNAKNALNSLAAKINALDVGQSNTFLIQGFKGVAAANSIYQTWYFVGWDKKEINKPDQCFFQSCICICKGDLTATKYQGKQELAAECANRGYCKTFNVNSLSVTRTVYVANPKTAYYNPAGGASGVVTYDDSTKKTCIGIQLKTNLLQIGVNKLKDEIDVTYRSDESADTGRNCLEAV